MEKIYGKHSVRAVFLERPQAIKRMLLAGKESYHEEFIERAREVEIEPEFMAWRDFLRVGEFTQEDKHQGICVFATPRRIYNEKDLDLLRDARVVLALDQISNPKNLATVLRGAAFFRIDAVVLLRNRSAEMSPNVTRHAVGGAEFVKIFRVTNLSRSLAALKDIGFWVYGLDEHGPKTLAETDFAEKSVLVVGAEGEGLRAKTRKNCDELVCIPGGRPGMESLNARAVSITSRKSFCCRSIMKPGR